MKANVFAAAAAPLAIIGLTIMVWRFHVADVARAKADSDAMHAQLSTELAAIKDGLRAIVDAPLVGEKHEGVVETCSGYNDRLECNITNVGAYPISMCWEGGLIQKNGGGMMKASILCSGLVQPRQTKEVYVPWDRGHAEDICNKVSPYGNKLLDWDACLFDAKAIEPPPVALAK